MSRRVPAKPGRHAAPAPRRSPLVVAAYALLAIVAVAAGALAYRAHVMKTSIGDAAASIVIPAPEALFHKTRIYALLLGIDYNYDSKDQQYSTGARSDTIMAIAIDLPTRHIDVVSVPRDMDAVVKGREAKINEAYADGGVKLADTVIGSWLGLPKNERGGYFDRFLVFKVDATKELINAIGGIDLKVDQAMNYDDNWGHLHIHFKPGFQHMNGDQAVAYSRFRHDELGDIGRIRRQQQVVRATINKLKTDKINDLTHISALIGVFNRNVITNVSDQEKESLAWRFSGVNQSDVKTAQIPYVDTKTTDSAGEMLIPDQVAKAKLVAQLVGPVVPAAKPSPAQIAAILPANVHVDVENGSGQTGMAARMAQQLRKRGYVVEKIGNADTSTYATTTIHTHSHVVGVGEKLRDAIRLPAAQVEPDAASPAPATTDATIIVGRDFAERTATLQ